MRLHLLILLAVAAIALAKSHGEKKTSKKHLVKAISGAKSHKKHTGAVAPAKAVKTFSTGSNHGPKHAANPVNIMQAPQPQIAAAIQPPQTNVNKNKKVVKAATEESSGELPMEEGSAEEGSAQQDAPPPAGGDTGAAGGAAGTPAPPAQGNDDFKPGPANTPAPSSGSGTPTPAVKQPGNVASTPNPQANIGPNSNTQFNPVLTGQHAGGSGCYATFNSQFNSATAVQQRNQHYATLKACLTPKCPQITKCNTDFDKCNAKASGNQDKIFECYYYWFGCSNEVCSATLR